MRRDNLEAGKSLQLFSLTFIKSCCSIIQIQLTHLLCVFVMIYCYFGKFCRVETRFCLHFVFFKTMISFNWEITTAQNYVREKKNYVNEINRRKRETRFKWDGDWEHLLELVSFQTMWASLSVNWSPVGRFPAVQLTTFWKPSFTLYSQSELYLSNPVLLFFKRKYICYIVLLSRKSI